MANVYASPSSNKSQAARNNVDLDKVALEAQAFITYVTQDLLPHMTTDNFRFTQDSLPRVIELLITYRRRYEEAWRILIANLEACRIRVTIVDIQTLISKDIHLIVELLHVVFENPEIYKRYVVNVIQPVLDLVQEILQSDIIQDDHLKTYFREALVKFSKSTGHHPQCLSFPTNLKIGTRETFGGYADIYKGVAAGQAVAIKELRLRSRTEQSQMIKAYLEEGIIWAQLHHQNILPFLGLYKFDDRLCFVSPWMENGDLVSFLQTNSSTSRMTLAHDVAHGVAFLHENRIVHGDLKGVNILITSKERACIADFGISKILNPLTRQWRSLKTTPSYGGTFRWLAPEILTADTSNNFATDVYALGCIFYEIFAGRFPFSDIADGAVVKKVADGERPLRPSSNTGLTDAFWKLTQHCWAPDPTSRPSAGEVVEAMHAQDEWSCKSLTLEKSWRAQKYPLLPNSDDICRYLQLSIGGKSASSGSKNRPHKAPNGIPPNSKAKNPPTSYHGVHHAGSTGSKESLVNEPCSQNSYPSKSGSRTNLASVSKTRLNLEPGDIVEVKRDKLERHDRKEHGRQDMEENERREKEESERLARERRRRDDEEIKREAKRQRELAAKQEKERREREAKERHEREERERVEMEWQLRKRKQEHLEREQLLRDEEMKKKEKERMDREKRDKERQEKERQEQARGKQTKSKFSCCIIM